MSCRHISLYLKSFLCPADKWKFSIHFPYILVSDSAKNKLLKMLNVHFSVGSLVLGLLCKVQLVLQRFLAENSFLLLDEG